MKPCYCPGWGTNCDWVRRKEAYCRWRVGLSHHYWSAGCSQRCCEGLYSLAPPANNGRSPQANGGTLPHNPAPHATGAAETARERWKDWESRTEKTTHESSELLCLITHRIDQLQKKTSMRDRIKNERKKIQENEGGRGREGINKMKSEQKTVKQRKMRRKGERDK